jgi:hypothetical protein
LQAGRGTARADSFGSGKTTVCSVANSQSMHALTIGTERIPPLPAAALEQRRAQRLLQAADLMADRAVGDMALPRRHRQQAVAGGGLEGAQGIAGRQRGRRGSLTAVLV